MLLKISEFEAEGSSFSNIPQKLKIRSSISNQSRYSISLDIILKTSCSSTSCAAYLE